MRNVCVATGHVAGGAIGLVGVMLRAEGVAMTGEAFRAVERGALFRRRRRMWVVASDAGHLVAGFEFADALPQRFGLAERADLLRFLIDVNVVVDAVTKIIARAIVGEFVVRLLNGDVAFEMALHANVVAARGREL